MTRIISKKQAIKYKTQKNENVKALSLVYALKNKGRLTREEFATLENSTRTGRLYWHKKLSKKI